MLGRKRKTCWPCWFHVLNVYFLFRIGYEQILQKVGKVDRTADEIFDDHVQNFNKQQNAANKLQKELNNYIRCVKGILSTIYSSSHWISIWYSMLFGVRIRPVFHTNPHESRPRYLFPPFFFFFLLLYTHTHVETHRRLYIKFSSAQTDSVCPFLLLSDFISRWMNASKIRKSLTWPNGDVPYLVHSKW